MKEFRQFLFLSFVLWSAAVSQAQQNVPVKLPSPPLLSSPVELFRRLLATNEVGREQFLASKTPEARRVIEAKLGEYTSLPAAERDTKLRELQLRWYVQQVMRMTPTNRTEQIARIPEPDRTVVAERIGRISILPPPLQQAVLTNPVAITIVGQNPAPRSADPRREQEWTRLMEFVEMTRSDREKVMEKLTPTEREQMTKTLSSFANLSREERQDAIQGFRKFGELSDRERTAFLSTAKQWQEMSEADRELWRKIVMAVQRSQSAPPMPSTAKAPINGQLVLTN